MRGKKSSTVLIVLLISLFVGESQARKLQQVCSYSCGDIDDISYPFRLKGDPPGCGDPDYELSCENNKTILEFHSGKFYVKRISYDKHMIRIVDVNLANGSCSLPYKSLSMDEVDYDFRYYSGLVANSYTSFVNCSRTITDPAYARVPCLSRNTSHVYAIYNSYMISNLSKSCILISMAPAVHVSVEKPSYDRIQNFLESGFDLGWSVECRDCQVSGDFCVITSLNTPLTYECEKNYYFIHQLLVIIFSFLWSCLSVMILIARFVLVPLVIFVFLLHKYRTTRKDVDTEEKFLHNQQSSMLKRYSYTDIIAMTEHFKDKLGQGGFGSVYKGQLPGGCLIAVKMLNDSMFSGEDFINEVSSMVKIHHINVVQLVGFCSEGSHRALVYEYMPNGSLDKHIFSKEGKIQSFSWQKLNEIALGTAKGIEYLHGGCDFDIKPHNILLDHNFIAKISDFGLTKFYPNDYDFVSDSITRGTIRYVAPELVSRTSGATSCKSDVYSFGMLLLEMAGGRRNVDVKAKDSSKIYFPSWVYDHLSEGGNLGLEKVTEIEANIAKKLCIVGLWCIQMKATDRPSMTKVVEMFEANINDLQVPPKPCFPSQDMFMREPESNSSTDVLIPESMERSHQSNV